MDRFPEAFERFESDVDIDRLRSYSELLYSFQWWAGQKWRGTARQWEAFNREVENLGLMFPASSVKKCENRGVQVPILIRVLKRLFHTGVRSCRLEANLKTVTETVRRGVS